jgi:hypothetical protein
MVYTTLESHLNPLTGCDSHQVIPRVHLKVKQHSVGFRVLPEDLRIDKGLYSYIPRYEIIKGICTKYLTRLLKAG